MSLEVIGAGTGRTGTTSLKLALEQLGFSRCYHMVELLRHPEDVGYWERANGRTGGLGRALRGLQGHGRLSWLRPLQSADAALPRGEGHPQRARS